MAERERKEKEVPSVFPFHPFLANSRPQVVWTDVHGSRGEIDTADSAVQRRYCSDKKEAQMPAQAVHYQLCSCHDPAYE